MFIAYFFISCLSLFKAFKKAYYFFERNKACFCRDSGASTSKKHNEVAAEKKHKQIIR